MHDDRGFSLVELLVVIVLLSIVGGATTSVVLSMSRTNQYERELRQVMDDGRVSLDRVRKELRGGRRILDGSTAHHLYWWNDSNQDGLQQTNERIHYCVAELGSTTCVTTPASAGTTSTRWQLVRWTDDELQTDARSIAKTLTDTTVFSGLASPVTATDVVTVTYNLDVKASGFGPEGLQMSATVRLRNVA